MTQPAVIIAPPKVEPYRHGLLGVGQDIGPALAGDPHWQFGGVTWESLASYVAQHYAIGVGQAGGAGGTKSTQDASPLGVAWPFAIYAAIECGSIGHTPAEFEQRARDVLELVGQREIEAALWTGSGDAHLTGLNAASSASTSTDVTPGGGPASLTVGVALLERWLRQNYAGDGIIHAEASVSAVAQSAQLAHYDPENPEQIVTRLGTRWTFGGGYDGTGPSAAAPLDAGTTWLYATGQIVYTFGAVELPANFEQALARSNNRLSLLAERSGLVGVDGPWAAVQVRLFTP